MTTPPTVEYRTIPLTHGQVTYVSPVRYEELVRFRWYAKWSKITRSYYAARSERGDNGKQYTVRMHRKILGLERGDPRQGDHRNRDTLDNTDENLRIPPTCADQQRNRGRMRDSASPYKGVTFDKREGKWHAQIQLSSGRHSLGYYRTAYEAHLAYCYMAVWHFGEFACLA